MELCRGRFDKVIVVNDCYRLAPWADVLYACDFKWWQCHYKKVIDSDFKGRKVSQYRMSGGAWQKEDKKSKEDHPLVEFVESKPHTGLSTDKNIIHQGSNSGYQAVNLAYNMGATQIYLLGFDMQLGDDGQGHWFGEHADKVRSSYGAFITTFKTIKPEEHNIEIINCTRKTALNCFPKMSLESALS